MPSLAQHQSNEFVKLLLLGDAKSGKTSSLVSLVAAGYKLRILDMDNLLGPLKEQILEKCPDKMDNVEFRTLRDKRKASPLGPIIDGQPKAFIDATKMLDHWKYKEGDQEIDLGKPHQWGADCVLVLDSLSRFCDAAYDFREPLTPRSDSTGKSDNRATYKDSQDAIIDVLGWLTGKSFETNVIVICHGVYIELDDGSTKIFPQAVGKAICAEIPQYFPAYVRYVNKAEKRTIQLKSSSVIDLANPAPSKIPGELPVDTGLATIFEALRKPTKTVERPKAVTLKRA